MAHPLPFVHGGSRLCKVRWLHRRYNEFLAALGLSGPCIGAIAMVVVSFALTTLDSATRLLRFNIEELLGPLRIPFITNRFVSSALACAVIAFFAFYEVDGKPAALALWALFGTTNQLLAGLTLIMVTLYLKHRGKSVWFTGIPALFMLGSTLVSMSLNLKNFLFGDSPNYLLGTVGGILLGLGAWLVVETVLAFRSDRRTDDPQVHLDMGA